MNELSAFPISASRRAGDLIFVSGQLALAGGRIVGDDIGAQTEIAIRGLERQLKEFGLDLSAVVKTNVWITRREDFAGFNAAYAARFAAPYPARSTVVSELALTGALIEIEAIAAFSREA